MKTKSSGAGAMFMKKRALEPELCIFTTAPQPWKNPHCSRAHRQSRVKIQQINCFSSNHQRFCKKLTSHYSRLLKLTQWSNSGWAFSPPLCCFTPLSTPLFFSPPCHSKSPFDMFSCTFYPASKDLLLSKICVVSDRLSCVLQHIFSTTGFSVTLISSGIIF